MPTLDTLFREIWEQEPMGQHGEETQSLLVTMAVMLDIMRRHGVVAADGINIHASEVEAWTSRHLARINRILWDDLNGRQFG